MAGKRISGIYAVTPENEDTAELVASVTAVLKGGASVVQYRNKSTPYAMQRMQCMALLACVRAYQGLLIVNDDSRLALDVGADGVHLGKSDESVEAARGRVGSNMIIGVSCYNDLERARTAQSAGADYIAFGSFFSSPTKPRALQAPLELLGSAKAELEVPIVAIGGINMDNATTLIDAGADALAIVSGIFRSGDIEHETRALAGLFSSSKSRH